MADQVMDRFKKKTKIDLRIPNVVPQANFYLAMVETEKEVVDEAQPVINRPGVGFKGFSTLCLPAGSENISIGRQGLV